jgi:hypothetical protein
MATVLSAAWAAATEHHLIGCNSGAGRAAADSQGVKLTLGQCVVGGSVNSAGGTGVYCGIWEAVQRTYVVTPVRDELLPVGNHLFRNYPNPFNPSTRIGFALERTAEVRIEVYDLKGRRVDTVLHEVRSAGTHTVDYEPRDLASGVYLVLMRAEDFRATRRIMLIK